MTPRTLHYVAITSPDLSLNPARYDGLGVTEDDARWVEKRLHELGLLADLVVRPVYAYRGQSLPEPTEVDAVVVG
ncbi:MAG: hypothetical protein ACREEP_03070 [Dongiaceae bacterium]